MKPGRAFMAALGWAAVLTAAATADDSLTTAVYAQVSPGYKRARLPDGTMAREYYAISNGGAIPGTIRDRGIEEVKFPELAGALARFLARRNYHYAPDAKSATLLIVVHWGRTIPFNDTNYGGAVNAAADALAGLRAAPAAEPPAPGVVDIASPAGGVERQVAAENFEQAMMTVMMENKARDRSNEPNARLLGYLREINEHNGIQRWAGGGVYYDDLIADIEEPRYYIIVSAYDFRKAVQEKKQELLWVTRISIRSPGNRFAGQMAAMLASASKYFGEESGRLVRQYIGDGRVEIGEATVVGVVSEETVKAGQAPSPPPPQPAPPPAAK